MKISSILIRRQAGAKEPSKDQLKRDSEPQRPNRIPYKSLKDIICNLPVGKEEQRSFFLHVHELLKFGDQKAKEAFWSHATLLKPNVSSL